jgi:hypothetical protein
MAQGHWCVESYATILCGKEIGCVVCRGGCGFGFGGGAGRFYFGFGYLRLGLGLPGLGRRAVNGSDYTIAKDGLDTGRYCT